MRTVHRIGFRPTPEQRRKLRFLGVQADGSAGMALPGERNPLVAFDVAEDHPNWEVLRGLFRAWDVFDHARTEFDPEELDGARWLQVGAWHHGYPQPHEDELGYLEATYDLSDWCERCGIGAKQRAPFQMKREPRWGRRAMMQLTWVYGELFVKPELWRRVFEPSGVGCRPVTNRRGVELSSVVQLVVQEEVGVETSGLSPEFCPACDRVKYRPGFLGYFPALLDEPATAMVRTTAWFGAGGQADRYLLASREIVRLLGAEKVRGASLWPAR